jgi:hypothetical protein
MAGALKIKVDGVWVDYGVGVPDEVYVGPTAPTDANVQLWYDTDEPAGLNPNVAWGQVATASYLSGAVTIATGGTYTQITNAIAVTLRNDRMYRLSWGSRAIGVFAGTAPITTIVDWFDGAAVSTLPTQADTWIWVPGNYANIYILSYPFAGDGAAHSYTVRAKMNSASPAQAQFYGGGALGMLVLEDVGPKNRTYP